GQANGTHRRLGAAADQTYHLNGRHGVDNQLGHLRLSLGRRAETCPLAHRLLDRADHARVNVAENQRPPGADVIEALVAIDVVEKGAFAARDEGRLAADGAKSAGRTVDAARDDATSLLERFLAADAIGFHRGRSYQSCSV